MSKATRFKRYTLIIISLMSSSAFANTHAPKVVTKPEASTNVEVQHDDVVSVQLDKKSAENVKIGGALQKHLERLEWAASNGDDSAEYNLGVLYGNGDGVPRDFEKARNWFEKAAKQGNAQAQYNLGIIYSQGLGVVKDTTLAEKWLDKAGAGATAVEQYSLGVMYIEGTSIPKNLVKARQWFEKSATGGYVLAQYNIGLMCSDGLGGEQNYTQAREWFSLAAKQGNTDAKVELSVLYRGGLGGPVNTQEADRLFSEATAKPTEMVGHLVLPEPAAANTERSAAISQEQSPASSDDLITEMPETQSSDIETEQAERPGSANTEPEVQATMHNNEMHDEAERSQEKDSAVSPVTNAEETAELNILSAEPIFPSADIGANNAKQGKAAVDNTEIHKKEANKTEPYSNQTEQAQSSQELDNQPELNSPEKEEVTGIAPEKDTQPEFGSTAHLVEEKKIHPDSSMNTDLTGPALKTDSTEHE